MTCYLELQDCTAFGGNSKMLLEMWSPTPIYLWYLQSSQIGKGSFLSFVIISAVQDQPYVRLRINMEQRSIWNDEIGGGRWRKKKTKKRKRYMSTRIYEEMLLPQKRHTWVNSICVVLLVVFFFGGTLETVIKLGFIRIFFSVFLCEGGGEASLRQKRQQEWIYRDWHFTASLISLETVE